MQRNRTRFVFPFCVCECVCVWWGGVWQHQRLSQSWIASERWMRCRFVRQFATQSMIINSLRPPEGNAQQCKPIYSDVPEQHVPPLMLLVFCQGLDKTSEGGCDIWHSDVSCGSFRVQNNRTAITSWPSGLCTCPFLPYTTRPLEDVRCMCMITITCTSSVD